MSKKLPTLSLFLVVVCTLIGYAAVAPTNHQKIESLIKSIAKINVPNPADDVIVPKHSIGFQGSGSNRQELFEAKNRLTQTLEKMVAFDPNADALYPGSVVQGKFLPNGVLTPIKTARVPLTITVTDLITDNPSTSFSRKVTDPTLASVTDAINQIVNQKLNVQQPAKFSYSSSSMNSVEEGFLRLGASYSWMSGHVTGSYQLTTTNIKSRFMVRFVQRYFTVSSESPSSPASFISKSALFTDFINYAGQSNPPAYVSSVTYGRELWLLIESSYEASQMKATLDAAFSGGFGNAAANLSDEQKQMLSQSSIQVLALGGGGTPAVKLINGDKVKGLQDYLLAGANYSKQSPGAIISYTCRYLLDNSIARVSSSVDYTINTSVNTPEKAIAGIDFTFLTGSDDKDDDNHVSISFILLPANVIIYQDGDIRPRQPEDDDPTWHDDTSNRINVAVNKKVFQSDPSAKQIKVIVSKSGGAHWHFGFDFSLRLDDGTMIPMGQHNSNQHNFGDNHNSESWTFSIPW